MLMGNTRVLDMLFFEHLTFIKCAFTASEIDVHMTDPTKWQEFTAIYKDAMNSLFMLVSLD